MAKEKWGFETIAIHEGQAPDSAFGSVIPPIYLSTTFSQRSPGDYTKYDYVRAGNPSRSAFEECLARLEGGRFGFAFASGCAATTTILHLLARGDHVVANDDMYGGTFRLFDKVFKPLGLDFSYADLRNSSQLEAALRPNTRLIWLETPTNPTLKIADIAAVAAVAKAKGILLVVDNTFMSPYFQNPLLLGADIVMHSTTKYIGGHSDMLGGAAVTAREDLADRLHFLNKSIGAVASPMDAYLGIRSLKTLAVRMQAHERNARAVADMLADHPNVERVLYPGHSSHPDYEVARRQMRGFGGMIAFYLRGGMREAKSFLENLQVITLAESLGGVESLVEHPAIMTHASVPPEQRQRLGISDSFIRLSVGIETTHDLIDDLDRALSGI